MVSLSTTTAQQSQDQDQWKPMYNYMEALWELHGTSWIIMEHHGNFIESNWNYVEHNGNFMEHYGNFM